MISWSSKFELDYAIIEQVEWREISIWKTLFLSAAIGQRPRSYLSSSCCCSSCSPFGSFPLLQEIQVKKFSRTRNQTGALQFPSQAVYQLSYSNFVKSWIKNHPFKLKNFKNNDADLGPVLALLSYKCLLNVVMKYRYIDLNM